MRTLRDCSLLAALVLLTACATGGGIGGDDGSGDFGTEIGLNVADYVILDLSTGALEPARTVDDLDSNPAYRDQYVVFRAVSVSNVRIGQEPDSLGAQADEEPITVSLDRYLLAVFELSRSQWRRIAGTEPWAIIPGDIVEAPAGDPDSAPAYGLSLDAAEAGLSAWSGGVDVELVLPTAEQWEVACRAGDGGLYSWNEPAAQATIATLAVVNETAGSRPGPEVVGQRQANAWDFRDMHGNVWELTDDGLLRGGSWSDPLMQARAANKVYLDRFTPHPLVGVRPVLILP